MNEEKINQLESTAEQNSKWLEKAREIITREKGKKLDTDTKELDEKVFQQYIEKHSEKSDYEYVVRGAKLCCRCGSHIRMLNLPECHGVYIKENPMVHECDCVQGIHRQGNISWFGVCTADRSQELPGDNVCYELTKENNKDGVEGQTEPGKKCQPIIVGVWQDVYDKTKIVDKWEGDIEREEALSSITTGSFLVCAYGGIIEPLTSGQEYVMSKGDLGLDEDGKSVNDNATNEEVWDEVEKRRREGGVECGNEECSLAHERYFNGDVTDHGSVHGTNYFMVKFLYEDGRIIDKQEVKKGESAKVPTELEEREGYIFGGWSEETENIQQDKCIYPLFIDKKEYIKNQLDEITDVTDWMDRKYPDIKLQTGKDLYVNILNDKELLDLGADLPWICGVLANMCIEGIPGILEGFTNSGYMENAIKHGYKQYRNDNGDILVDPKTIEPLEQIANCTIHAEGTCGFGFGMFQWTFKRTGKVLLRYKEKYTDYAQKLTYKDRFDVEWEYFKEEMMTDYYKKALTKYVEKKTGDPMEDAKKAAEIFRRWYEGNNGEKGISDAKKYAENWINELGKIDLGD